LNKLAGTPKFELDENEISYLSYIFQFIDREGPINQTTAGYFQKILNSLINRRGFDVNSLSF